MIGSVTDPKIKTQIRPGVHVGMLYRVNVHDLVTVSSGFNLGIQSLNLHYSPSANNIRDVDLLVMRPYLSVPIEVLGRIFVKPKHFIELGTGVSLYMYLSENVRVVNEQPNGNVMELDVSTGKVKPLVNMDFKMGYGTVLPNLNVVIISMEFGKSFSSLMQANYRVRDNDLVLEQGSINARNDVLALKLTYVLTRAKGMLHQHKRG